MRALLKPSTRYLDLVCKPSVRVDDRSKQQLLILDLNGTLVSRVGKRSMYARPYSQEFLNYVFDNFNVMLWSSARPHSVRNMSRLFTTHIKKLVAVWDRESFGLSKYDYNRKCLTIKDLDKVWDYFDGQYDATNTILIDDSPEKAQLQPYNCVHPHEFEHTSDSFVSSGESELLQLIEYLKILRTQSNVSNYIKNHPYNYQIDDTSKNTFLVEHYIFSDPHNKPARTRNLRPTSLNV
ncbi:HAD-like domain-containing protein [Blakeslea trispora]|nr:HAD-like domain-containing protein [Blakeslea trispora]